MTAKEIETEGFQRSPDQSDSFWRYKVARLSPRLRLLNHLSFEDLVKDRDEELRCIISTSEAVEKGTMEDFEVNEVLYDLSHRIKRFLAVYTLTHDQSRLLIPRLYLRALDPATDIVASFGLFDCLHSLCLSARQQGTWLELPLVPLLAFLKRIYCQKQNATRPNVPKDGIRGFVLDARCFFPNSATAELLALQRPYLNPLDGEGPFNAALMLLLFPTFATKCNPPDSPLWWLSEALSLLVGFWLASDWVGIALSFCNRLAYSKGGYVPWTLIGSKGEWLTAEAAEHAKHGAFKVSASGFLVDGESLALAGDALPPTCFLDALFASYLRVIDLPVAKVGMSGVIGDLGLGPMKEFYMRNSPHFTSSQAGQLAGHTLDNVDVADGASVRRLRDLLSLMEPYMHPSTTASARIQTALATFVAGVCTVLCHRVRQQGPRPGFRGLDRTYYAIPERARVNPETLGIVAGYLMRNISLGLYSKATGASSQCASAFGDLAMLTTATLLSPMPSRLVLRSLQVSDLPHQMLAVMPLLGPLIVSMLSPYRAPELSDPCRSPVELASQLEGKVDPLVAWERVLGGVLMHLRCVTTVPAILDTLSHVIDINDTRKMSSGLPQVMLFLSSYPGWSRAEFVDIPSTIGGVPPPAEIAAKLDVVVSSLTAALPTFNSSVDGIALRYLSSYIDYVFATPDADTMSMPSPSDQNATFHKTVEVSTVRESFFLRTVFGAMSKHQLVEALEIIRSRVLSSNASSKQSKKIKGILKSMGGFPPNAVANALLLPMLESLTPKNDGAPLSISSFISSHICNTLYCVAGIVQLPAVVMAARDPLLRFLRAWVSLGALASSHEDRATEECTVSKPIKFLAKIVRRLLEGLTNINVAPTGFPQPADYSCNEYESGYGTSSTAGEALAGVGDMHESDSSVLSINVPTEERMRFALEVYAIVTDVLLGALSGALCNGPALPVETLRHCTSLLRGAVKATPCIFNFLFPLKTDKDKIQRSTLLVFASQEVFADLVSAEVAAGRIAWPPCRIVEVISRVITSRRSAYYDLRSKCIRPAGGVDSTLSWCDDTAILQSLVNCLGVFVGRKQSSGEFYNGFSRVASYLVSRTPKPSAATRTAPALMHVLTAYRCLESLAFELPRSVPWEPSEPVIAALIAFCTGENGQVRSLAQSRLKSGMGIYPRSAQRDLLASVLSPLLAAGPLPGKAQTIGLLLTAAALRTNFIGAGMCANLLSAGLSLFRPGRIAQLVAETKTESPQQSEASLRSKASQYFQSITMSVDVSLIPSATHDITDAGTTQIVRFHQPIYRTLADGASFLSEALRAEAGSTGGDSSDLVVWSADVAGTLNAKVATEALFTIDSFIRSMPMACRNIVYGEEGEFSARIEAFPVPRSSLAAAMAGLCHPTPTVHKPALEVFMNILNILSPKCPAKFTSPESFMSQFPNLYDDYREARAFATLDTRIKAREAVSLPPKFLPTAWPESVGSWAERCKPADHPSLEMLVPRTTGGVKWSALYTMVANPLDKIIFGWHSLPSKVYLRDRSTPPWTWPARLLRQPEVVPCTSYSSHVDLIPVLREAFIVKGGAIRLIQNFSLFGGTEPTCSRKRATLWKKLCRLLGPELWDTVVPHLRQSIQHAIDSQSKANAAQTVMSEDRTLVTVAMECIGGFMRAASGFPPEQAEKIWDDCLGELLPLAVDQLPLGMRSLWESAIWIASYDVDSRRIRPLRHWVMSLLIGTADQLGSASSIVGSGTSSLPLADNGEPSRAAPVPLGVKQFISALRIFRIHAPECSRGAALRELLQLPLHAIFASPFEDIRQQVIGAIIDTIRDAYEPPRNADGLPSGGKGAFLNLHSTSTTADIDFLFRNVFHAIVTETSRAMGVPDEYLPLPAPASQRGPVVLNIVDEKGAMAAAKTLFGILQNMWTARYLHSAFVTTVYAPLLLPYVVRLASLQWSESDTMISQMCAFSAAYLAVLPYSSAEDAGVMADMAGFMCESARSSEGDAQVEVVPPSAAVKFTYLHSYDESLTEELLRTMNAVNLGHWRARVVLLRFVQQFFVNALFLILPRRGSALQSTTDFGALQIGRDLEIVLGLGDEYDDPLAVACELVKSSVSVAKPASVVASSPDIADWPGVRLVQGVLELLRDTKKGVSEYARYFTALATTLLSDDLRETLLIAQFAKMVSVQAPTKRFNRTIHAGILGYSGIIAATPHIVPDFVCSILAKLARLNVSPETAVVVKSTFAGWWRSHHNIWTLGLKDRFNEEEREAVVELSFAPSYYA